MLVTSLIDRGYEKKLPSGSQFNPAGVAAIPLYILAQGIERFLEPFTKFLGATSEGGQTKSKEQAMKERDATFATLADLLRNKQYEHLKHDPEMAQEIADLLDSQLEQASFDPERIKLRVFRFELMISR